MDSKTILLLGGTGKVASRITPLLSSAGYTTLVASRSGTAPDLPNTKGVKFDWFSPSSWTPLFATPISAIFLVAPPIMDLLPTMQPFIDLAISRGVKRLVLLSASVIDVGDGLLMGQVASYIADLGIEYAILRPTWFMENFSEGPHAVTVREGDNIITAAGDGRVPFVACADIAAVAFKALTHGEVCGKDYLIVGSEAFSFTDVAAILTKIMGRQITHVQISEEEEAKLIEGFGIPAAYAKMLAELDTHISQGKEEITSDAVLEVGGKQPVGLEGFLEKQARKGVWDMR